MLVQEHKQIITNGDMSGNLTSDIIPLGLMWGFAAQAVFTGSPTGTWSLQMSVDDGATQPDGTITGVTHWSTYAGSGQPISAAGSVMWDVTITQAKWARVVYAFSSGTGSANVKFEAKGE